MICVSLGCETLPILRASLETLSFAEIRLDRLAVLPSPAEVDALFCGPARLIATCRPGCCDEERRAALLIRAVQAGAAFVDVECESPPAWRERVLRAAESAHCSVVISYHNYRETPSAQELHSIHECCRCSGADLVKIACRVNEPHECARLLALVDSATPTIAIGMGALGRITRLAGVLAGAPFTYASLEQGRETADGQLDVATVRAWLDRFGKMEEG